MIVNELQGSKKKKEVEIDLQSIMAPLFDERCSTPNRLIGKEQAIRRGK
jgi:hypothetical protein